MPSDKTVVIEHIWEMLKTEGNDRRIVYAVDVLEAIKHCNAYKSTKLGEANPANFMKDVVRPDNASDFWPPELTKLRVGARQRPGDGRVFEFTDFEAGQTEPFPNKYAARPGLDIIPLEALSLSLAKRSLGRKDESWLIQVSVELRVVQTHFATKSKLDIVEISHLQTGVKLGNSEVDSLFLGHMGNDQGTFTKCLLTCEAKQEGQRILEHQIVEQIVAASKSVRLAGVDVEIIIPFALKATNGGCIYCVEFEPWDVAATYLPEEKLPSLKFASEALYQLKPPVPGIGYRPRRRRKLP